MFWQTVCQQTLKTKFFYLRRDLKTGRGRSKCRPLLCIIFGTISTTGFTRQNHKCLWIIGKEFPKLERLDLTRLDLDWTSGMDLDLHSKDNSSFQVQSQAVVPHLSSLSCVRLRSHNNRRKTNTGNSRTLFSPVFRSRKLTDLLFEKDVLHVTVTYILSIDVMSSNMRSKIDDRAKEDKFNTKCCISFLMKSFKQFNIDRNKSFSLGASTNPEGECGVDHHL